MPHPSSRRRRTALALPLLALGGLASPFAHAQGLAALSDLDAGKGVRTALELGAAAAVQLLGRPDGFLGNPQVRIPLPGHLRDVAKLLAATGLRRQVEELETAMNRAAEAAVPMAAGLLRDAVRKMTVDDARRILTGGDTAATDFFRRKTSDKLYAAFKPVVSKKVDEVGATKAYKSMIGQYDAVPMVSKKSLDLDHYVTEKALAGLFHMLGQEEKAIRTNPAARSTELLKSVFGK